MATSSVTETTQFLTFVLAEEVFAVDIGRVKEVLEYTQLTKVPRTPKFMCGVINLRGSVVPVMDMRQKFNMSQSERTVNTCIIIIEVTIGENKTVLGAMADSVKEVMSLDPDQIDPPPKIGAKLRTDFIRGMGKQGDHFIIILDTDKVFSAEELEQAMEMRVGGMPEAAA
ncbi:chemotaxis protein CheW [Candidatus Magnetaquicoccus inordinatus]|uniref:chemotaxis protein CheW n=1 Tax=Candidatus Magnetaquicoccus inordinatus TaxID=2496818 RepID=UPI00102CBC17|nr:chemotaxis protein CheW [Candidatus Magnetaquicoccus inordinatus]